MSKININFDSIRKLLNLEKTYNMNQIIINGVKYDNVNGNNIIVRNGSVMVGNQTIASNLTDIVKIEFIGDLASLDCTSAVINGNVQGNVDGTSITVNGNVQGDVDGTNIKCEDIGGSVDGVNINCKSVKGGIKM